MPQVRNGATLQTKVNALHLLIDIVIGIAYGPQGTASDMVRAGTAPPSLITTMYDILSDMKENEKNRLSRADAFMEKVKELRICPRVGSALPVWGSGRGIKVVGFSGNCRFQIL
jgi:hypothetical protein